LQAPFADEIKKEIDAHFPTLAREVGKDLGSAGSRSHSYPQTALFPASNS